MIPILGRNEPDPHFPLEISPGCWSCAVPACPDHRYPTGLAAAPMLVRFNDGEYAGREERILHPPQGIKRGGTEYALDVYAVDRTRRGHVVAVYSEADKLAAQIHLEG